MKKEKPQKKQEVNQLEEQLRRALADYDNLKKQTQKEKQEFSKFANQILIENIVGIWEGLHIITKQFRQLLENHGFEEISVSVGDPFDPHLMEAIISEGKGEQITAIITEGYRLHGKVVKPTKVKVGKLDA
ncbi:nucleotide exchange factor GrpE [Patescibacteria group bacterium]|nr:nucleotide exchange factor GrpE [Patescibacteria group bacterium]MBU1868719.1 nucleotide exchange factor GrpE [Patescibacteria group bacterium]